MNRPLVRLLAAVVVLAGCSEESGLLVAPDAETIDVRQRIDLRQRITPAYEDSMQATDHALDVSLASAGSIVVAAGSMDYSFTLRFRRFTGAACTGGPDLFTNVFGVSDMGVAIDFGTRLSVQLEAATAANDGTPFNRWQGPASFVSTNRTICVDVPAGMDTYLAMYEVPSNLPPVLDPIQPQTVDEGTALMFTANASDPDLPADVLTFSLSGAPAGAGIDPNSGEFSWTPIDDDGSPFTFAVIVTDAAGASAQQNVTIVVNNVAPQLQSLLGLPIDPVQLGAIDFNGGFADPGTGDVHTLVINCDFNGSALPGTGSIDPAAGSYAGSCTFASPGIYQVRVEIADDNGGAGDLVSDFVVVYDPSGGFVTGGGWYDSQPGAYRPDPALTGKAHFGFVSKYKKDAATPSGNTEFTFQAAGIQFRGTDYDWLVVASDRARFRGRGEINGNTGYAFEIDATDGNLKSRDGLDRIRVRIWDDASGDIVYDNGAGNQNSPDPMTALIEGSIVIHDGKVTTQSQRRM